jgi:hypothetical protein
LTENRFPNANLFIRELEIIWNAYWSKLSIVGLSLGLGTEFEKSVKVMSIKKVQQAYCV